MKYVFSDTLQECARRYSKVSWEMRLRIALDISRGMEHLHQLDILHGDLKAANVMLASQDPSAPVVAMITDFGTGI